MRISPLFAVLSLLAMAVILFVAAWRREPGLNVPPWVAYVMAAGVSAAAVALIARAQQRERLVNALAVLILASFTVTGAWISIGAGARRCTASGLGFTGIAADTECRVAFGAGAVICLAMTVLACAQLLRRR